MYAILVIYIYHYSYLSEVLRQMTYM